MKLNFRQGLVSFQKNNASSPSFLNASSTSGYIDLAVSPTPFIATIAHLTADYLIAIEATNLAAWGPLIGGTDNYLYIGIDLVTGATNFGITILEPIVSAIEPSNPIAGQAWFDLNSTTYYVRNNTNTKFVPSPRVFVAKVPAGNVNSIQMYGPGSQVGLNVDSSPGYLMLDELLRPLRTSAGTFLTTDTPVRVVTSGTSGILSSPLNAYVPVRAGMAIPAMSLVYFSGADTVSLASSDPSLSILKTPVGIVKQAMALNDVGVITQSGEIAYDQWTFTADQIGLPLYCGFNGEVTLTRPQGIQVYRVGYIKNSNSILFNVDSETQPQVYSAPGAIINAEPPLTVAYTTNNSGENVTTVSLAAATPTNAGYMTMDQAETVLDIDLHFTTLDNEVAALQTGKANVVHTHISTDITDLATLLAGKMDANVNFDSRYSLITHEHDERYALILHTHSIAQVDYLQDALNNLAPLVHTHVISDVTGLQAALDAKAFENHTQAISTIVGLQTALDGKAPLVHTHAISDVSGLQSALDQRSLVGHTHPESDITNLIADLNNKQDVNFRPALSSLTDVDLTMNDGWVVQWSASESKFVTAAIVIPPTITNLVGLNDVNATSLPDGGVVKYDAATSKFIIATLPTPSTALSDLSDVSILYAPTFGQYLEFDGANWRNMDPPALDFLPLIGGATTGDVIIGGNLRVDLDLEVDGDAKTTTLYTGMLLIGNQTVQNLGSISIVSPSGSDTISGTINFNAKAPVNLTPSIGSASQSGDLNYRAGFHNFLGNGIQIGDNALIAIHNDGSIMLNSDPGIAGQVMTSAGPNLPVVWTNIPTSSSSGASTLATLTDVDLTANLPKSGLVDGMVLTYDTNDSKWEAREVPSSTPSITLEQLTDVSMPYAPNNGDLLSWNGTAWVAYTPSTSNSNYEVVARLECWTQSIDLPIDDGPAPTYFRSVFAYTIGDVFLSMKTAPTQNPLIVDVLVNGTSIFSTKPQIDVNTRSSLDSTTQQVKSVPSFQENDEITINVSGTDSSSTGLIVTITGQRI